MRNIFKKPVSQIVRDEINELRGNHSNSNGNGTSPMFTHYQNNPQSNQSDSYSHTASSTAGYSQNRTYPNLPNFHQTNLVENVSSSATNLVGNLVGPDLAVSVANAINGFVAPGASAREILRNGALVQFASKSSGRLLQIVLNPEGSLTFDGNGLPSGFNTYFIVEEGEKGRLRFHNNCNFLAFDGKHPCVLSMPPGPKNNPSIEFRVHEVPGKRELIALESCMGKNYFISVMDDGFLKKGNTKEKTIEAQFSVINAPPQPYTQYPMMPQNGFMPQSSFMQQPDLRPQSAQNFMPSAPPPPSYEDSTTNQNIKSNPGGLYPQFQ